MKISQSIPPSINPVAAFGVNDSNLRLLERLLKIKMFPKENELIMEGEEDDVTKASQLMHQIYMLSNDEHPVTHNDIKLLIEEIKNEQNYVQDSLIAEGLAVSRKGNRIKPRTSHQVEYIRQMLNYDLTFAIGPAGTGKTYLAVGLALHMLLIGRVKRVILTRPVVEAGESLGFLPGTLEEKIDPYLRPLFDAINGMLSPEETKSYMESQTIELAPLAYMRGRTLSNSFIILDEAQNTIPMQMKMFLTRLGENSKMVVTGDITQIDLPYGKESGLKQASEIFKDVKEIKFTYFDKTDVIRHGLVKKILNIYEKRENETWKDLKLS